MRKRDSKRIHVLNKLFMRYVTDLMSSSEFGEKMYGHRIEINRVSGARKTPFFFFSWALSNVNVSDHVLIECVIIYPGINQCSGFPLPSMSQSFDVFVVAIHSEVSIRGLYQCHPSL